MGSTRTSMLEILRNANSSVSVLRSCGSARCRGLPFTDAVATQAGTLGQVFARHVEILCAALARVNVSVLYQLLTPPNGLGLLASPSRQVPFRSGSAWLGRSQKDGLPVLPRGEKSRFSAVRFKTINSRTKGEGQPGRCPFLIGSGNGRQDARPRPGGEQLAG